MDGRLETLSMIMRLGRYYVRLGVLKRNGPSIGKGNYMTVGHFQVVCVPLQWLCLLVVCTGWSLTGVKVFLCWSMRETMLYRVPGFIILGRQCEIRLCCL